MSTLLSFPIVSSLLLTPPQILPSNLGTVNSNMVMVNPENQPVTSMIEEIDSKTNLMLATVAAQNLLARETMDSDLMLAAVAPEEHEKTQVSHNHKVRAAKKVSAKSSDKNKSESKSKYNAMLSVLFLEQPPFQIDTPKSVQNSASEKQVEPISPKKIEFVVNKFITEGDLPIDKDDANDYLEPLAGKSYDLKSLQDVAQGLENLIRDEGFAFYRVVLPPQSIEEGDVHLNVVAYTVENINIEGNTNFSKESIENSLPSLVKDISPNAKELSHEMKVANRHPSKQVQITFSQHEMQEKVDANVTVTEQPRPYQFSLGFNNNGSDSSGEYRLTGGFQYSNLWGLDHVVNASYTLPPDHADTVQQYGGMYALPLYKLGGWLNAYYASSNSNNGVVANDLTITGAGEMMGIHYQQFLPKWDKYEHILDVGLDSKHFINDVQFKNVQLGTNVRSVPFSISYKAEYPIADVVKTGYFAQWAINTGLLSDNTDALYRKSRAGSSSSWQLFRYGTNLMSSYQNWIFSTSITGQYSEKPLIAGEQIGIGGSFDVRGYEQRETGADNGQIAKIELTSPEWEKINAFVFYDYGHGSKEKPLAGEIKNWNLSGTGVGAKVAWQENLNASLTLATALNDATTTKAYNNRLLLNVNLRY